MKTAILSANADTPSIAGPQLLDEQLPPLNESLGAVLSPLEPPDPTRYTTGPSAPPAWLTPAAKKQRPSTPTNSTSSRDAQRSVPRTPPQRPAPIIEQTVLEQSLPPEQSPPEVPQTVSAIPIAPPAVDIPPEPAPILEVRESPSDWLIKAQEIARTAQSPDELLAVTQLCERITNESPQDKLIPIARKLAAWAHNRRGELLVDAGQPTEAILEFHAAIESDPKNSLAIHNRAVTRAQQSDFDAALADFNRVIQLNPGLAVAYRNRAELLATRGNAEDAISDYSRAIEAMPDDAELYRARAHALQQLNEFDPALSDLDHSIRIAPHVAQGYTQRGNLLADRGEFDRALDDFKQALAIDPKLAEAHRGLAWIKATCPDQRHRDPFEALAAALKAVKLTSPDDYLALDALAAAHANAGEFDKAIAAQQQAMNTAPSDALQSMQARLSLYEQHQPYRVAR